MFCGYLVYRRVYFPEFAVASRSLDLVVGTLNTAVLICSSLTVAMSVRAAQLGKRKLQVQLLLATIFFGLVFLSVKGYEWRNKYKEHHIPTFDYNAISGEGDLTKGQESLLGLDKLKNDPVKLQERRAEIQQRSKLFFSLYFALTGMHAIHMVVGVGLHVCHRPLLSECRSASGSCSPSYGMSTARPLIRPWCKSAIAWLISPNG